MRLGFVENWALCQLVGTKRKIVIAAAIEAGDYATAGAVFADWLKERFTKP